MPVERFFIPSEQWQSGDTISLKGSEFHHLAHVMRMRAGDTIECINGKGSLAQAKIVQIDKHKASLEIIDVSLFPEPSLRLILALGLLRPQKLDWIMEKGTELGIADFWLFPAEKSAYKNLQEAQRLRMENLCISALKQSGRLHLPHVIPMPALDQWRLQNATLLFGDLRPQAPKLSSLLPGIDRAKNLILCVGPESGFSAKEIELLVSVHKGQGVSLNSYILRAETAALSMASITASYLL